MATMIAGISARTTTGSRTSFLKICSSFIVRTSHFLLHRKLLIPSSLTFAAPVRTIALTASLEGVAFALCNTGKELAYVREE